MKRVIFFILSLIVLCQSSLSQTNEVPQSQPEPTKYGLVLSGGGAKGLAHVGLLRMIDSLEIHVDYITGTSMGAVLSGLYAAGYSADELKKIVADENWERIISNKQPYNLIHSREKDDYDAYPFEFPLRKGIPALPTSIIEGQYLMELLLKYGFPVRHINDFHKMPIPVELVASDIVDGGAVVMKAGFLPLSIRASLAIPAAFSPAVIDKRLLVDGGLDRNFPVEEVQNMGAEYVIGSYTGSRLRKKEELSNSALNMVHQSYALLAKRDVDSQKQRVNLMLDFSVPLKEYGTSDFRKHNEIVAIGEKEARKLLPQLQEIKRQQTEQGIRFERKKPQAVSKPIDRIRIADEMDNPLSKGETDFIKDVLGDDLQELDSASVLQQKIEDLIGYNRYNKVYYTYSCDSLLRTTLNFYVKKKPKGTFYAGLYYDLYESANIILNYTYRDLFFKNSRFSAKAGISEKAKLRINYYKFLDNKRSFWISPYFSYRLQNSSDLYLRYLSQFNNNNEASFYQSIINTGLSIGHSFTHNSELELGLEYNYNHLWQPNNIFSNIWFDDAPHSKLNYRHGVLAAKAVYTQNNLNKKFFATQGNNLHVSAKLFFKNHFELSPLFDENNKALAQIHSILHPDSSLSPLKGQVLQLSLYEHYVKSFSKNLALHTRFFYGLNLDLKKKFSDNFDFDSFLFLNQKFYMGGFSNLNADNTHVFTGLRYNEYPVNNVTSLYVGLQYNPVGRLYVTPSVSMGYDLFSITPFSEESEFLLGYGIDVDYMSLIGPIKVSWTRSNLLNKNRLFISLGYAF